MFGVAKLTYFGRKTWIFAAKGPAYHYAYGRWRLNNWLQKVFVRSHSPDVATLLTEIDLTRSGLIEVNKAVAEANNESALSRLMAYFRTRRTPMFFFDQEGMEKSISLIDRDQREASIHVADEICQDIFRFRRVGPVRFKDGIDWTYRPHGNTDWTWDLSRHTYFEALGRAYWYTGDERYAQKFRDLLLDWLANNPAGVNQPNWASVLEVAFRVNTWIWAFYYFRSSATFDDKTCVALLKGLLAHGRYLDANLELHVRNNHLLLEAKALAMLGLLFPEFKRAEKWRRRGLRILCQQVEKQVCPDGVHGERSTFYHRVIAGELLELLVLLDTNGISIPPEIAETLDLMVEFELWITKPDGLVPLFGDSALEDTCLRFSAIRAGPAFLGRSDLKSVAPPLDEASIWLLGPKRVKQYLDLPATELRLNSRAFPRGGYFVMRQGQSTESAYLAFDCGPFGYKPAPSHGHADALSFELHAHGQTLLVDPGVYSTYLGQDWRNFFRSSRAHNTVVIDGQDQSVLMDSWRVYRPAQTVLHRWISNDRFDFVDGSHNGYERLSAPITHRRQVFFAKPEYWVVVDTMTGEGEHCFSLCFHLGPGLEPVLDSTTGTLCTTNGSMASLAIVPLAMAGMEARIVQGQTDPIQGWVSFFSGEKQEAPVLCYRYRGAVPVQLCTLLYPAPPGQTASLAISSLVVTTDDGRCSGDESLTGLEIHVDSRIDYLVLDRRNSDAHKLFAGYKRDGPAIYVRGHGTVGSSA